MPASASDNVAPNPDDPLNIAGRHWPSIAVFGSVTVLLLAADLITKTQAWRHVPEQGTTLIPGVLKLKLVTNTGAVFGMGQGGQWLFSTVSIVAAIVIARIFWRSRAGAIVLHTCLGLILAGALGNLYDRLFHGHVRDLLYLFPDVQLPFGLRWPNGDPHIYPWIFNVADVCLVGGVAALLLVMWRAERGRRSDPSP